MYNAVENNFTIKSSCSDPQLQLGNYKAFRLELYAYFGQIIIYEKIKKKRRKTHTKKVGHKLLKL